jgi:hypothetical protein
VKYREIVRGPGEIYRTTFVALLTGILSFIAGALVQGWAL